MDLILIFKYSQRWFFFTQHRVSIYKY